MRITIVREASREIVELHSYQETNGQVRGVKVQGNRVIAYWSYSQQMVFDARTGRGLGSSKEWRLTEATGLQLGLPEFWERRKPSKKRAQKLPAAAATRQLSLPFSEANPDRGQQDSRSDSPGDDLKQVVGQQSNASNSKARTNGF